MAEAEEEEEGQVEASLEELIAKKADRPTITDDEDEDGAVTAGRDEGPGVAHHQGAAQRAAE